MNRVPVREGGQKSSDSLERRVNLLTALVVVQIVLLAVLLVAQFMPAMGQRSASSGDQAALSTPMEAQENASADMTETSAPVVKTPESGQLPPEVPSTRPVRVEILNGCGVPKLAAEYADLLRSRGYDVRDTRNADRLNYEKSIVYDRTNLPNQAERLAAVLGIDGGQVIDNPNPQLVDVDLTLILGNDHANFKLQP